MRIFSIPVMRWLIVVAAFLVWVNAYTTVFKSQTLSAPLTIEGLPQELAIANTNLTVEVKLSGRLFDLQRMRPNNVGFTAKLPSVVTTGLYEVDITPKVLNNSVAIADYSPKTISLAVESRVEKAVPILVSPTGAPADNFSVKSVASEPSMAILSGAGSLLSSLSEVHATVSVTRRAQSFTEPAQLEARIGNDKLSTVKILPESAKISVEIAPGATFRNLGLRAAFSGELPGGFWVQEVKFSPATLVVRGTAGDLEKLFYLTTTPIKLEGRTRSFTERVAVDLPNGIETPEENLVSAEVIIGSGENTRQFEVVPKFVNVTEGFSVTSVTPAGVSVVVTAPAEIVAKLTRSDIVLNVDLSGSLSGGNTVKITDSMFVLPDKVSLSSFGPDTLEIVLTRQE